MPITTINYVGATAGLLVNGLTYAVLGWITDASGNVNAIVQSNSGMLTLSGNIFDTSLWTVGQVGVVQHSLTVSPLTGSGTIY